MVVGQMYAAVVEGTWYRSVVKSAAVSVTQSPNSVSDANYNI